MFEACESRLPLSPIKLGEYETREEARAAILDANPRFAEVAFELDGENAADMAIATRFEMRIFVIERREAA